MRRRLLGPVLFVTTVAALTGTMLYLRTWPPILVVMSSSMEPAVETGAIVVVRRVDTLPNKGDVVSVEVPVEARERYGYPDRVLHRVIEVTADGLVRTQGDNLPEPDPFAVPFSDLRGSTVVVVPGAGDLVAFLTSPYGLLWLGAGLFLFLFMPLIDSQRRLRLAVSEYGYHLRSHTEIVRSMASASQDLAATTRELQNVLTSREGSLGVSSEAQQPRLPTPPLAPGLPVTAEQRPGGRRPKGRHRQAR